MELTKSFKIAAPIGRILTRCVFVLVDVAVGGVGG
jgi:hypothetical protein